MFIKHMPLKNPEKVCFVSNSYANLAVFCGPRAAGFFVEKVEKQVENYYYLLSKGTQYTQGEG